MDFGPNGPEFVVEIEEEDLDDGILKDPEAVITFGENIDAIQGGLIFLQLPNEEQLAFVADANSLADDISEVL